MTNQSKIACLAWVCKCGETEHRPEGMGKPSDWHVIETDGEQELLCGGCTLLASYYGNTDETAGDEKAYEPATGTVICEVKPGVNTNLFLRLGIYVDISDPDCSRISINDVAFLGSERIAA
ncbi:hypothetical protein AB1K62_00435 [Parasphingorhabdus sp. JC815]|uniref:hypothetical protein n=1 Tax=Parasphingorhabdus sp. JC815 TaxID=3232140 RepID=UPI00345AE5B4